MDATQLCYIDSLGYHYADYPTFLAFYTAGYQQIYGDDIYLLPDSQDGQAVVLEAQAAYDAAAAGAVAYSSFSPLTGQGTGLSRTVQINGIARLVASNSTAELTIVGTAFTTITNGIAQDVLQQQWALPSEVTIPEGGETVVTATAVNPGALQAQPDTITTIFTPTNGWQTVNNAAAATPGAPVENDAALRQRQAISTANPSLTVLEGSTGAIANVPGVTQVQPYENYTGTTDSNGIPGHSVSFVVLGGTDDDVASSIALHKTPGTGTYGTTSVPTVDANGVPITIDFFRPTNATIDVQVSLTPLQNWITTNETIIAAALAAFIVAIPIGGIDLGGGSKGISFSQLFAVAYVPGTTAVGSFIIESIELSKNGGGLAEADIELLFNEKAICDPTVNVTFVL